MRALSGVLGRIVDELKAGRIGGVKGAPDVSL